MTIRLTCLSHHPAHRSAARLCPASWSKGRPGSPDPTSSSCWLPVYPTAKQTKANFIEMSARDLHSIRQHILENRPYALTSRLHNYDAMLGAKTCRAARMCCAGRAHWRSVSQSVRGPGPARRYGMQGLALWLHAWRWRMWQCHVWPPTRLGALLWRHMHKVYR